MSDWFVVLLSIVGALVFTVTVNKILGRDD